MSPPLAVKTPYNKTDLDEFRDSLGEQSLKFEISSNWRTKMKDAFFVKEEIKTRHNMVRYTLYSIKLRFGRNERGAERLRRQGS